MLFSLNIAWKGNNCHKKMEKANNSKIKSETNKWYITISYKSFYYEHEEKGSFKNLSDKTCIVFKS